MLVIRLARQGRTKYPVYRIVAADSKRAATGKFVAILGHYNPHTKELVVRQEEAKKFLANGAQPSNSVIKLFIKDGIELPAWAKLKTKAPKKVEEPEVAEVSAEEAAAEADAGDAATDEALAAEEAPAEEVASEETAPAPEPAQEEERVGEIATAEAAANEDAAQPFDHTETAADNEAAADNAEAAKSAAADAAQNADGETKTTDAE